MIKKTHHILYLLVAFIVATQLIACKKDSNLVERHVIPVGALTDAQTKPSAKFETNTISYYKNKPIVFTNTSSSPTAENTYLWTQKIDNVVTILSTQKEVGAQTYANPQTVIISLYATSIFGTDSIVKTLIIGDVPKSAQITDMTLDSVNYINPNTGNNWNLTGGPNVLYKFYDVNTIWVDSVDRNQNGGLYGWASPLAPVQLPFLVLNNVNGSTPWAYPKAQKYILFNKMLDVTNLRIYNKDVDGNLQLIAEIPFTFINYFRNEYADSPNSDYSTVKLRSLDGLTVIIIKIKYLT
jgi:hypothetical protein